MHGRPKVYYSTYRTYVNTFTYFLIRHVSARTHPTYKIRWGGMIHRRRKEQKRKQQNIRHNRFTLCAESILRYSIQSEAIKPIELVFQDLL